MRRPSVSAAGNRYRGISDDTMPIRPEYRAYYGRQWRAYRAVLLALRGEKCSACGRTVPKYLNLAHSTHDPLTSSVAFLCVSCHTRADAPHRLAVGAGTARAGRARCGCFRSLSMPLRRCGSFRARFSRNTRFGLQGNRPVGSTSHKRSCVSARWAFGCRVG